MSTPSDDDDRSAAPWATLRVELSHPGDDAQADAWAQTLEALAAWVAEEDDVGGVETRDRTTLGDAVRPELWVYTVPAALDRLQARVQSLAQQLGLPVRLTGRVREDDDWRDAWKRFYQPQIFGEEDRPLLLRPSWLPRRDGDPVDEIVLDPGHAFGTGLHESTRLCLDRLCAIVPHDTTGNVLDLGCGSGILGIAVARLAPSATIVAADIDPDATATTADNAERNGVADRLTTVTGELDDVPELDFSLVVANIRPVVLVPLAAALRARLREGTHVLLSGIYGEEHETVRRAWLAAGYDEVVHEVLGDWSLLQMEAR